MYKLFLYILLWSWGGVLLGQVERIYDPAGHILAINPLNEDGLYEGTGYSFYPNGAVAKETPYRAGSIEGTEREFYEGEQLKAEIPYLQGVKQGWETRYYKNGTMKMERHWVEGVLEGEMKVYYPNQRLQMWCQLHHDSIMYAQHFDPQGVLKRELMGDWQGALDTTELTDVILRVRPLSGLRSAESEATSLIYCQAYIPGVPTALTTYAVEGGELVDRTELPYLLAIKPQPGVNSVTLYLQVSLRPGAGPVLVREVEVAVR